MAEEAILLATFDKVADPEGGDRLVKCDTNGRLEVVTIGPPGSDMIQGKVADGAPAGATFPVIVSGKDGAGTNRALETDTAGALAVFQAPSSGDTVVRVPGTLVSTTLLSANPTRREAFVENSLLSAAVLFVKLGAIATGISYTKTLFPGESWPIPKSWKGVVDGFWSALAPGTSALITELVS